MAILEIGALSDQANLIFEQHIKPLVAGENPDDFLAIDIVSGDYEIAADDLTPGDKLRERHQSARVFLRRVGDEAAYTVGGYQVADGSRVKVPRYLALVIWDGVEKVAALPASGHQPLLGTGLLDSHRLNAEIKPGGMVTIEALT